METEFLVHFLRARVADPDFQEHGPHASRSGLFDAPGEKGFTDAEASIVRMDADIHQLPFVGDEPEAAIAYDFLIHFCNEVAAMVPFHVMQDRLFSPGIGEAECPDFIDRLSVSGCCFLDYDLP